MNRAAIVLSLVCLACQGSDPRTANEHANAATVARFVQLYNEREVEQAVGETMAEQLDWAWTATPLWPAASGRGRDGFLQGLVGGLAIPDRQLTTRALIVDGDAVVHRADYTGQIGNAQIIQFFTMSEGKITAVDEVDYVVPSARSSAERDAVAIVEAFFAAYNSQTPGWFERYYHPEIEYVARFPGQGRVEVGFNTLRDLTEESARNVPDRSLTVAPTLVDGEAIVVEGTWSGTVGPDHPTLDPGHRLEHHYIGIYRIEDGRIAEVREVLTPIAGASGGPTPEGNERS